jgi:tricorn protease
LPKPTDAKPGEIKSADAPPPAPTPLPIKPPEVKMDLDGIGQRLMEVPVLGSNYRALTALPGKIVYLASDGAPGLGGTVKLKAYDLAAKKEIELGTGISGYALSADNKKMAVRTPSGIQVVDAGMPLTPGKMVDLSAFRVDVEPEKEWKQIFEEAWRNHRDTFYDPNLHGQDWEAVRRKYEALLPTLGDRSDLNLLISEMQGELNVSHEFNGGGFERRISPFASSIGALGADLTYDTAAKAYKITRILPGDGFDLNARSPLLAPGLKVKPGQYVLTIDGRPLPTEEDPSALLQDKGGKAITLQVNDKPTLEGARLIRIKAMANDSRARYYAWVQKCRDYVTTNGGANLGYLHLPDMGNNGITEFTKHFYANLDKDGLIIDVRYNQGGIVSGQILERLRRVIFEYDQSRYGKPVPYHYTAYPGRVVILCNEWTSSDGEYFCTGARYMKLGPVVGTRTWGGYMAVGGFQTIDGGSVSTPQAGSFTPEGKWLPDGYGFTPDFLVDDDPNAFVAGRDPQLDKALELLKAEIKRNPPYFATTIPPPSKEKAFAPNRK